MSDDMLNILIILLVVVGCAYFFFGAMNMKVNRDGFANPDATTNERENAQKYLEDLKSHVTKMKAGLNVVTYRKTYEDILLELDDFIGYAMLKSALDVKMNLDDPTTSIQSLEQINQLNNGKRTLNDLMKWLDTES